MLIISNDNVFIIYLTRHDVLTLIFLKIRKFIRNHVFLTWFWISILI